MIRRLVLSACAALALALLPQPAAAERVALVIGNGLYRHVPALPNPPNDAGDVAQSLARLGFTVSKVENATYDAMRRALLDFGRRARGAEMAVVFFAGHGMEVGGENWLIPVDAELKTDADAEHEAVGLKSVMGTVDGAAKLGLVVLDACRNNPFTAKMQRSVRTRAVPRGLVQVEPTGNVLVAYAAKDGTTAEDGRGRNSPFTQALLKHVETPGLEITFVFRNVRDDVMTATRRAQQPFVYGSLSREAIYLKTAPAPAQSAAPAPGNTATPSGSGDEFAWSLLKDTTDPAQLRRFVTQFPGSPRRSEAAARLLALEQARLAAVPPAAQPQVAAAAPKRIVVDFDAINALGNDSGIGDARLAEYLSRHGVRLVNSTAQRIAVFDERNVYEGKAVKASSGRSVLMQQGGNPVSYTLEFATPLKSISFERVALVAGPSGITHPTWTAVAQDATGKTVATASEDVTRSFSDVPGKTFTLTGTAIKRLVVTSDHKGFAAFSSLVLDNLVLVTE
jgi:uncharacterized caspase-like protein